jgi:hypothetical protein
MKTLTLWRRMKDRYRSLSPRDRRAIVIGAVILIPALTWSLLVQPYRATLEDLQDRLAAEQALWEREQAVVREASSLSDRIETTRLEITRLEMRLVRADNPALAETEITARLERLARTSRVLLKEVRSIPASPRLSAPAGVAPLFLSVSGESDFQGVLDFFRGVEQDHLLLGIDEISVGPAPAAGGAGGDDSNRVQSGVMRFSAVVVAFMFESPRPG